MTASCIIPSIYLVFARPSDLVVVDLMIPCGKLHALTPTLGMQKTSTYLDLRRAVLVCTTNRAQTYELVVSTDVITLKQNEYDMH